MPDAGRSGGWYVCSVTGEAFYHSALAALLGGRVRFVVVGGVAVNLQGVPRFTADLDIAIALDAQNLPAAIDALTRLGLRPRLPVPPEELKDVSLVQGWIEGRNLQAITMSDPAEPLREVDLVVASPVPFEELDRTATRMRSGGLEIAVASIEVLIRMKTGTGRAQDESDVDALRRIQELEDGR